MLLHRYNSRLSAWGGVRQVVVLLQHSREAVATHALTVTAARREGATRTDDPAHSNTARRQGRPKKRQSLLAASARLADRGPAAVAYAAGPCPITALKRDSSVWHLLAAGLTACADWERIWSCMLAVCGCCVMSVSRMVSNTSPTAQRARGRKDSAQTQNPKPCKQK